MLNLSSVLEHSARLVPDRIAITCGGRHITYAELNARATRVAAGLASIGIVPGDRVLLSCPNVPWFPIAYFGILKAGTIVVPINVLLKPREIAYTAVILYTSGTTGQPKGAELTHANMVTNAMVSFDMFTPALELANQSAALITLPLFHSTGQTCQMNAGLYGGMRLVLHHRFDP